jgi:hypothetical protein
VAGTQSTQPHLKLALGLKSCFPFGSICSWCSEYPAPLQCHYRQFVKMRRPSTPIVYLIIVYNHNCLSFIFALYIKCWFYVIKYIFCIKNDVNTIECTFNLGKNKTNTLPSVRFF